MTLASLILSLAFLSLAAPASAAALELRNDSFSFSWLVDNGSIKLGQAVNKMTGDALPLACELFRVELSDGSVKNASDFILQGQPTIESLPASTNSSTAAEHLPGKQIVARFAAPSAHLDAVFRAILRDNSSYIRQELTLQATGANVPVRAIVLFDSKIPNAKTVGSVDGSPVVADTFFFGYEHPMARNLVADDGNVRCSFVRNAALNDGEALTQSMVLGAFAPGQLRRDFLKYVERERAHPYRPFLHYNSWFDIAWDKQKFTEAQSLAAMTKIGQELVEKRGVKVNSFLFDDGWDDNRTLWKFHDGFPDGFSKLKQTADDLHAGIGVWISPFGGYDLAKLQRLAYGREQGFETNSSGFSLSGPKYYERFHDICMNMVTQYGVNQFKFDGLAAGASANGLTRDGDAMLRLISDLRRVRPDIYINQTVGTWPSPFWLRFVDSTWRGGDDHSFAGAGPAREQWITYRDAETYQKVVQRGPLYPLNSIMLHGIIYAVNAEKLATANDDEFTHEVRSFFGSGTQLQELYLTPRLLHQRNWDDLAEAAQWSRANADVLVDTHWVGGDPGHGEVYGWASWSPRKAILVLRNPSDRPASFTGDPKVLFELPPAAPLTFAMSEPWKNSPGPAIQLTAGEGHQFRVQPFQVLVLESR